jgi:Skp family chaperone for outer membrane proteins
MSPLRTSLFRSALVGLVLVAPLASQVTLKRGAVVFHGSASNTSAPATIEEVRVREATREWHKIQAEGIDPDSAQGKQLIAQMNAKIREAVKAVATAESRDLVARKGDIADRQGRDVIDLTDRVIAQL